MLTIDDREPLGQMGAHDVRRQDISPMLTKLEVPHEAKRIDVGDYIFWDVDGDPCLITRKSSDLLTSVFDGHLSEELEHCINFVNASGGGRIFFLVEGVWATAVRSGGGINYFRRSSDIYFGQTLDSGADPFLLPNLQVSIQTAGIFYVSTGDLWETALALKAIYRRGMDGWPTRVTQRLARPTLRWSKDDRVARLMAIWPKLSEQLASNLLARYEDMITVFDAVGEDPKKFAKENDGIGEKLTANILEVLYGNGKKRDD